MRTDLAKWAFSAATLALTTLPAVAAEPADPLSHLAKDVSGVFDISTDPRILLLEEDHGVFAARTLRPGEEYAEGWNLQTVQATSVTLKKGDAVRTIVIKGRDQIVAAVASTAAASGAPPPQVLLATLVTPAERPPKPEVNRPGQIKANGAAAHTADQLIAMAAGLRQNLGDKAPSPSDILVTDLKSNLGGLGPNTSLSHIPNGQMLAITGEIWLSDGGYSPRVTSYATNGTANSTFDMAPAGGSGIYGSATTYDVDGDLITVHKVMQVGGQSYVMPALTVRSGETAVVNLPDGSVFRITPVIQKGS